MLLKQGKQIGKIKNNNMAKLTKKQILGRGLSALLKDTTTDVSELRTLRERVKEYEEEVKELKEEVAREKRFCDVFMTTEIKSQARVETLEKELGYYHWFDEHMEQFLPDTVRDMRNGNHYSNQGWRKQYDKEMEEKNPF